MKVITITVSDDAEPSCAYIGGLNPREAAMACYQAYEVLCSEFCEMTVDRSSSADWQP